MNLKKIALGMALIMAATSVPSFAGNAATKNPTVVTTPRSSLPKTTDVAKTVVNINAKKGSRTYTIYGQHRKPLSTNAYIEAHGCALCSLTTVIKAYSTKYASYTPQQVKNTLEKKTFGKTIWKSNYKRSLGRQLPISMYGISRVLSKVGIKNKYVRTFTNKQAEQEIKKHLKSGNPVIVEANNRVQYNGKFGSYSTRWARGKHSMVLLGMTDDGRVIVGDSAERTWSKKNQRIKYGTVKDIVARLIPCTTSKKSCYFSSTAASGGYVLVNPQ